MAKATVFRALTEYEAVEQLSLYDLARRVENRAKALKDDVGVPIKAWLEAHPGDHLVDGERRLRAFIQERQATDTYDIPHMPDALILWAARTGLLSANDALVRGLAESQIEALDMRKWAMPGKPSGHHHLQMVVEKL